MNVLKPLASLVRSIGFRFLEKDAEFGNLYGSYGPTASGINVTPDAAMRAQTVYGCTRVLAEDTAVLPGILYKSDSDDFRERDKDNQLYPLLHDMPNATMTANEFWQHIMWHKLLRGVGYARIFQGPNGIARELRIMNPDRVKVLKPRREDELPAYEYYDEWNNKKLLRFDEVFKVYGPFGMSILAFMRETIGLQLAQTQYSAKFFANFGAPRGVVQFKGSLGEDEAAIKRWKQHFVETYSGDNAWGVAVLENGAEFKPISVTPKDAEFILSEKLTSEQICGGFRVPPYKVGNYDRATWSNIENAGQDYLNNSLMIHLVAIHQAVYRDLFTPAMRRNHSFEFLTAGILRGDIAARYSAYQIGRQNGWLSPNDIKRKENENPISKEDGGDTYLVPMNSIPANMIGKTLAGKPQDPPEEKGSAAA